MRSATSRLSQTTVRRAPSPTTSVMADRSRRLQANITRTIKQKCGLPWYKSIACGTSLRQHSPGYIINAEMIVRATGSLGRQEGSNNPVSLYIELQFIKESSSHRARSRTVLASTPYLTILFPCEQLAAGGMARLFAVWHSHVHNIIVWMVNIFLGRMPTLPHTHHVSFRCEIVSWARSYFVYWFRLLYSILTRIFDLTTLYWTLMKPASV